MISTSRHRATIICKTSRSIPTRSREPARSFSQNGKITRNDGTNWQNVDAKFIWRPYGFDGPQESASASMATAIISITRSTAPRSGTNPSTGNGQVYSDGIGETRTGALWLRTPGRSLPQVKLTLGGRLKPGGRSTASISIPPRTAPARAITSTYRRSTSRNCSSTNFSPKASLSYDLNKDWNITANFGEAYRYPTVTELYQNITVKASPRSPTRI